MGLKQSSEKHVWKIGGEQADGQDFGYLAVYVDNILCAVKDEQSEALVEALQGAWKCSPAQFVEEEGEAMRFCGFELSMAKGGAVRLSQEGFMKEMVKKRGIENVEQFPVPAITDEGGESPIDLGAVKQAQGMVGELTWLATRSRPDIAYE